MNKEEFNLSDKMKKSKNDDFTESGLFFKEDVKEFIRLLKEAGKENDWDIMLLDGEDGDITISFNEWIDKLAGEELLK